MYCLKRETTSSLTFDSAASVGLPAIFGFAAKACLLLDLLTHLTTETLTPVQKLTGMAAKRSEWKTVEPLASTSRDENLRFQFDAL